MSCSFWERRSCIDVPTRKKCKYVVRVVGVDTSAYAGALMSTTVLNHRLHKKDVSAFSTLFKPKRE